MQNAMLQLLYKPSTWADMPRVHSIFESLRATSPVLRGVCPGFPDLWHVTKHADIFEIERQNEMFLSNPRLTIMEEARENAIKSSNGGSVHLIKSLVTMDDPEHRPMRMVAQSWFMPRNLRTLQDSMDRAAYDAIGKLVDAGGECDFASEVAVEFPLRIIMSMLGLPLGDYKFMLKLTKELFGPEDPDTRRAALSPGESPATSLQYVYEDFVTYFLRLARDRRLSPKGDLASLIANSEIDGKRLSDEAMIGYYIIIATAGHDTTTYTLNEAVRQLALHPKVFEALKSEPDHLAPLVANEAVRLASPTRHFVRTASREFELRGRTIKPGESVVLWYPSGSRDEEVFEEPNRFNPMREHSVRHAAFGHGPHKCLGMHLALQEITTFLKALASEVDALSLVGEPEFIESNFVGGVKRMRLRVRAS